MVSSWASDNSASEMICLILYLGKKKIIYIYIYIHTHTHTHMFFLNLKKQTKFTINEKLFKEENEGLNN